MESLTPASGVRGLAVGAGGHRPRRRSRLAPESFRPSYTSPTSYAARLRSLARPQGYTPRSSDPVGAGSSSACRPGLGPPRPSGAATRSSALSGGRDAAGARPFRRSTSRPSCWTRNTEDQRLDVRAGRTRSRAPLTPATLQGQPPYSNQTVARLQPRCRPLERRRPSVAGQRSCQPSVRCNCRASWP